MRGARCARQPQPRCARHPQLWDLACTEAAGRRHAEAGRRRPWPPPGFDHTVRPPLHGRKIAHFYSSGAQRAPGAEGLHRAYGLCRNGDADGARGTTPARPFPAKRRAGLPSLARSGPPFRARECASPSQKGLAGRPSFQFGLGGRSVPGSLCTDTPRWPPRAGRAQWRRPRITRAGLVLPRSRGTVLPRSRDTRRIPSSISGVPHLAISSFKSDSFAFHPQRRGQIAKSKNIVKLCVRREARIPQAGYGWLS